MNEENLSNSPNGPSSNSWVQFDEEAANNKQDPDADEQPNNEQQQPPVVLPTPSQRHSHKPSSTSAGGDDDVYISPPVKNPRNLAPLPIQQPLTNLVERQSQSETKRIAPQPNLPPPPQNQRLKSKSTNPAVIDAQSVQLSLESGGNRQGGHTPTEPYVNGMKKYSSSTVPTPSSTTPVSNVAGTPLADAKVSISELNAAQLQNVPLNEAPPPPQPPAANNIGNPVIRQGFANGDVIVTLLPQNTSLPWITPAQFRPELVPEELMAQGLTLTVEDYVHIMSQLVSDPRFSMYNICYKRIIIAWIFLGFVILLAILFSGLQQLHLFGAGIAWLLINAVAIFFCMWVKIRLNKSLEECIAEINLQLMRHKILLGLDDRGKLSCHKVNLAFIYFDSQDCLTKLQEIMERELGRTDPLRERTPPKATTPTTPTGQQQPSVNHNDIVGSGSTNVQITRQQEQSYRLLARYSQRWVKALCRGHLFLTVDTGDRTTGVSLSFPPRHIINKQCACQFIEDYLRYKPQGECLFCSNMAEVLKDYNTI